jgi:hypothetical protein
VKDWKVVRRYLPFICLVVIQIVIIVAVPSTGKAGAAVSLSAASKGTSHCVGDREFSPSIDYYAPSCTAGPIGSVAYPNGGSTYEGVTSHSVTIIDYIAQGNAIIDSLSKAQGTYESFPQAQGLDHDWQNFINSHYVLWGRQVHIETYQGQCATVPPDDSCLLAEMDSIVQTYHPYAVFWNSTVCSQCFARLAADNVVTFGGQGFSDAFARANAPYFYSPYESSTHIEEGFANLWCNQLSSVGTSRVASFAPDKNHQQDLDGRKRVLGIISTNDADNEDTVTRYLVPLLKSKCGQVVNHLYFYSENVNTALQQVQAGLAAMDTSSNPATDVLCLCDSVAPAFIYEGEQHLNYWPENLVADVQGMGYDVSAQSYEPGPHNSSSLGCPKPSAGCEFSDAFGLLQTSPQTPENDNAGIRTLRLGGAKSIPITGIEAEDEWSNYQMMASLIENAGPDLTPKKMEAAAPRMMAIGGGTTGHYEVKFSPGNYNWTQDAEVAYWDQSKKSLYNDKLGTWVPVEGSRFLPNGFPKLKEPPIPKGR